MQSKDLNHNSIFGPSAGRPGFFSMLVTQELSGIYIPHSLREEIKIKTHGEPYELSGYFTGIVENGIFHAVDNSYVGRGDIGSVINSSALQYDQITRWKDDFKLVTARKDCPNIQTLVWHSQPFVELGPFLGSEEQGQDIINEHYTKVKAGGYRDLFDAEEKGMFVNSTLNDAIAYVNNIRALKRFDLPYDIYSSSYQALVDLARMCGFTSKEKGAVSISDVSLMEKAINHTQRSLSAEDVEMIEGPQVLVRPWPEAYEKCEILPYGKPSAFKIKGPDLITLEDILHCNKGKYEYVVNTIDTAKKEASHAASALFGKFSSIDCSSYLSGHTENFPPASRDISGRTFLSFENCPVLNEWLDSVKNYAFD